MREKLFFSFGQNPHIESSERIGWWLASDFSSEEIRAIEISKQIGEGSYSSFLETQDPPGFEFRGLDLTNRVFNPETVASGISVENEGAYSIARALKVGSFGQSITEEAMKELESKGEIIEEELYKDDQIAKFRGIEKSILIKNCNGCMGQYDIAYHFDEQGRLIKLEIGNCLGNNFTPSVLVYYEYDGFGTLIERNEHGFNRDGQMEQRRVYLDESGIRVG